MSLMSLPVLIKRPEIINGVIIAFLQSVTVPLQGFLNAIIYGSTREDFVHMMGTTARFFAAETEGDGSEVHVIRSEHEGEGEGNQTDVSDMRSLSYDSPGLLTDSENFNK